MRENAAALLKKMFINFVEDLVVVAVVEEKMPHRDRDNSEYSSEIQGKR